MMDLTVLMDEDKRYPASVKKLERLAQEGRFADLSPLTRPLTLVAALLALRFAAPSALSDLGLFVRDSLVAARFGMPPDLSGLPSMAAAFILPPVLAILAIHLVLRKSLGVRLWAPMRCKPDPARPFQFPGARSWSPVNLAANGFVALIRLAALGGAVWAVWPGAEELSGLPGLEAVMFRVPLAMGVVWLALGAAEYAVSRQLFAASQKMTDREVKEEQKASDGDSHVGARLDQQIEAHFKDAGSDAGSRT